MIAFTRPWFLLLLIIPLLWLLFLAFNRRRSNADVPSTMIWKQVLQSKSQRRFHARSRLNLILLLQLTVLLSGIMTLAGLSFYNPPRQNQQDLIIVIDTSASMQVTQDGISRFSQARNAAIETVNSPVAKNGESRRIALIELAARPRIIHRFTANRNAVTAALRSLTPSDEAGDADTALQLAYDLRSPASDTGVLLLSDGAFQLAGEYPGLQVRQFGEPAANNGISRFSIRKVPRRENEYQLLCEFFSSSENELELSYSLLQNGTRILSNETAQSAGTLAASGGRVFSRVHTVRGQPGDIFRLQIDGPDALEADNTAFGVIPRLPRPKVLCVTPGNLFLENFFAVFDDADAFISSDPIVQGLYDVVLFDGPLGSLGFPAAVLKIDSLQNPDQAQSNLTTAAFAHQVSDHPLLAGLDLTGLSSLIDPEAVIRMPADSRILVRSAERP
ncbi:MAG: vWA domain-containing protein, partial [Spirochaetota bacterium]